MHAPSHRPTGEFPSVCRQIPLAGQSICRRRSVGWLRLLVGSHLRSCDRHAGQKSNSLNTANVAVCQNISSSVLSPTRTTGGRPQEGSVRDGASGPSVPAHGSAHHSCGADPGEDDPLGGLPCAAVAEILLQSESPTWYKITITYLYTILKSTAFYLGFTVLSLLLMRSVESLDACVSTEILLLNPYTCHFSVMES